MPPDDSQDERRRHQRAPVDLEVSLRFSSVQQFLSAHAGDISAGDRVLLVMAGYGMNWQATLLERV